MTHSARTSSPFDLRRIDLNLLLPLHAVLEECSVSAAARRLGLTQPAVSQSLAKLRRHFGDDLLSRGPSGYVLTPLATDLRSHVEQLVSALGQVLAQPAAFDPALSERTFDVVASDYAAAVLGPPLVKRLADIAPGVRLRLRGFDVSDPERAKNALASADGLIIPRGMNPPGESISLFVDSWCCVVDPCWAEAAATWTAADFTQRKWVATEINGSLPAQNYLRHGGVEIDVTVMAQTFTAVPFLVAGTPYVGVLHRRHAELIADVAGVAIVKAPWAEPAVHMVMFYDTLRAQDPALQWFLDEAANVAASLEA
jgi:DNA-binding transcriptional LysR family regulator